MNQEETQYHTIGEGLIEAELGQMFGKPCFKVNKKAFVCFFQIKWYLNFQVRAI